MAAHLALMEFPVRLYNRSRHRLQPISLIGGIELVTKEPDLPRGLGPMEVATTDMGEALEGVEVIMVCVPANGHVFMAETMAPHVRDGQIVVLNPGRTGGALEVHHVLKRCGVTADICIAEAQTFLYASRVINPAQVQVFRIKNSIPVAALPAWRTPEVVQALRAALRQFVPGDNVMKTSLDNIGAVFHPAVTVFNAGRIESTHGEFEFYIDGVTPSVAHALEALDAERVAVAEALGFRCLTAREWLYMAYDAAGTNLYEAMRANRGYYGISGPLTLDCRYLNEDVPMSLVPLASLGEMLEVPTPMTNAVIRLASLLRETDYRAEGRTVERLGLAGLSVKEIRQLVLEGQVASAP